MGRSEHFATGASGHHQLKMFMTPDELIDTTDKMDSGMAPEVHSPRAQWEHPHSGEPTVHAEEPFVRETNLRDVKLRGIAKRPDFSKPYASTPPVEISHRKYKRPMLSQGHHRLAHAEQRKTPFLAVIHRPGF